MAGEGHRGCLEARYCLNQRRRQAFVSLIGDLVAAHDVPVDAQREGRGDPGGSRHRLRMTA